MNTNEIDKKDPLYIVGMFLGTIVIGFLFGIGYNISLMLFN